MSVAVEWELPDQPPGGSTDVVPLGGNGFTAPHSAHSVTATATHDASGGNASIQMRFDPRYTQLVSYVSAQQTGSAADVDYFMEIQCTSNDRCAIAKIAPVVGVTGLGTTNLVLWTPPAVLCSAPAGAVDDPPYLRVLCTNVDGDSTIMRARVYNFDKRARELVPLPQLLACLVRGTNDS